MCVHVFEMVSKKREKKVVSLNHLFGMESFVIRNGTRG
jgi:hypothetical protein